jgi:AcrR family transcriptional regulator
LVSATTTSETPKATSQKERIREITAKLFAEKGYRAVGVAEIGEAVGLGRGALYYHIGSKEDLLYDIVIRYITDLVRAGHDILEQYSDPHERITQLSRYLMRTISNHLSELTVCFREADALTGDRHKEVSRLHFEYQEVWATVLKEGAAQGVFRELQPVALKGILGMYFYSFLWLNPNGRYTSDEIADVFADIVFRASDNRPGSVNGNRSAV